MWLTYYFHSHFPPACCSRLSHNYLKHHSSKFTLFTLNHSFQRFPLLPLLPVALRGVLTNNRPLLAFSLLHPLLRNRMGVIYLHISSICWIVNLLDVNLVNRYNKSQPFYAFFCDHKFLNLQMSVCFIQNFHNSLTLFILANVRSIRF